MLNNLGLLNYNSGRLDEAFASYRRALEFFRSPGELRAQVVTLNNLGLVLAIRAQPREALAHHRQALELARAEGYRAAFVHQGDGRK